MEDQETTTATAEAETTPSTETSAETLATVNAESTTAQSSEDEFNVPVDLESVPKEHRQLVEKYVKKYEKDFKGAYTKKTQDYSTKTKAMESELSQARAEKEAVQRSIQEALADPTKYEAYRKLYGMSDGGQAKQEEAMPEFKTVGELLTWNQQYVAREARKAVEEARQAAMTTINQTQEVSKWRDAVSSIKAKDPKFTKYESLIVKMAGDPQYRAMYQTSGNANEVLSKVYEDFQALLKPDMDAVKQATLDEQKKKKAASTTTPGKAVATEVSKANQPMDVVLNRIRERTAHLR